MNSDEDSSPSHTGSSGIALLSIFVDKIDYSALLGEDDSAPFPPPTIEILSERQLKSPYGFVRMTLKCSSPVEPARGHILKARMIASYKQVDDSTSVPFEQFLTLNAPASMFAFMRELVYSITSRSPVPPILLDPVNMMELMRTGKFKYTELPDPMEQ